MEPFYTLVCEFNGGTYVSQFQAIDELHAVTVWASEFSKQQPALDQSCDVADAIGAKISDGDTPVRLEGLTNAWCATAVVGDELALLNIVKTSRD